jgi:hypothetical protein
MTVREAFFNSLLENYVVRIRPYERQSRLINCTLLEVPALLAGLVEPFPHPDAFGSIPSLQPWRILFKLHMV